MSDETRRDERPRPSSRAVAPAGAAGGRRAGGRDADLGPAEPAAAGGPVPNRSGPAPERPEPPEQERAEAQLAAEAAGPGRQASLWSDAWRNLRRNPSFIIGAVLLAVLTVMAVAPQLFTDTDPRATDLALSRQGPSADAWFGYDTQGHDYYSYVIYGARVSMIIGLLVVMGALLIGLLLGAVSGYFGGWIDTVVARFTDIIFGLPLILGAILVLNTFDTRGVLQVALALIVLSWMTPLRLVRSSVISIKDADYVQAARALGANDRRIITRHILPNALAPVLVYGTILVGVIIAAEATLSFLGVGLQLPAISWGLMINSSQNFIRTSPHLLVFPGLFLAVTVLAFILIGDALRDALDPKLR